MSYYLIMSVLVIISASLGLAAGLVLGYTLGRVKERERWQK